MTTSMTGFGRGEHLGEEFQFSIEAKSVNHRYLDINVKMPRKISFLEEKIKLIAQKYIKRGRLDIFINMEVISQNTTNVGVDFELAKKYLDSLNEIKNKFELKDDISTMSIARFPDVIKLEEVKQNEDVLFQNLEKALKSALEKLKLMRETEGLKLAEDILERSEEMLEIIEKIDVLSKDNVLEYQEKLYARIKELIEDKMNFDESRLCQEVAIFADKTNITEEIVRFKSHIKQLKETIQNKDAVGRKLDFLIQEMNREINTIGSKSSKLEVTKWVVHLKSELEKIREQVQNIE